MGRKGRGQVSRDYSGAASPWSCLATMILVQAAQDYKWLEGNDTLTMGGETVVKAEVVRFFRSQWAEKLAESVGLEPEQLERFKKL